MDIQEVEKRLGVTFQDKLLLMQALTHKSYLNEDKKWSVGHNERLEFMGDAVLELLVTEFLFKKYPNKFEGELTTYRAALVCTETHFALGDKLGLWAFIKMSRGQANELGRAQQVIVADAYEALIGALYLDQGAAAVKSFVERMLLTDAYNVIAFRIKKETKSRLQELAQQHLKTTPTYELLEQSGPDHNKMFIVGVFLGGTEAARGTGSSKQRAEEAAARTLLQKNGWLAK